MNTTTSGNKTITIVTHCYSSPEVPIYHKLLWLQYLSLRDQAKRFDGLIEWMVCWTRSDKYTHQTISNIYTMRENVYFRPIILSQARLFRRAIGRNMASTLCLGDVVWYTDVDHLFLGDSLSIAYAEMIEQQKAGIDLIWPRYVNIHKEHALGDALIDTVGDKTPLQLDLNEDDFIERKEKKAIGGLQITTGAYARLNGYLKGTSWVEPERGADHFLQCKCDVPYRRSMAKTSVDIDGVYRVRHTRAGRDRGAKDHGTK